MKNKIAKICLIFAVTLLFFRSNNVIQTVKADATGDSIVSFAASQTGVPYCWDGGDTSGPTHGSGNGGNEATDCGDNATKGFDCGGLAIYAIYKATGITTTRTTFQNFGTKITDPSQLQPGDIILFGGDWNSYDHVGIYDKDGYMWNANTLPNEAVQRVSLKWETHDPAENFIGAIRVATTGVTPPPPPALAAPVITSVGGDQTNDVTLTWSESGSVSSFNIYRNGIQIGSVPGSQFTYADTSLPNGGELNYQVQAVGSGGPSDFSAKVTLPYLSSGQSGVDWVTTGGHIDYCRRVGVGNNQSSQISCTPFSNGKFGATKISGVLDWGYDVGRAWITVGNNLDYCRRAGLVNNQSSHLECTPFNGTTFGSTVTSPVVDWGYDVAASWVSIGSGAYYCRRAGLVNNQSSYLECTSFNGTSFGQTITSPLVDWGYDVAAAWVHTKSGVDYCRRAGLVNNQSSYLECTPFNGKSFGPTVTSPLLDWGYDEAAAWVPAGLGVDYCRRAGLVNNQSSYLECTPFNGTNFGQTVTSPLVDWGYDIAARWVSTGLGVDYCRRAGLVNNQSSYLECTSFNGTSFGQTVTSPLVDWGYNEAASWVSIGSKVDYCRRTGGGINNQSSYLECTPFNGTTFGSTTTSPLVDWGYDI